MKYLINMYCSQQLKLLRRVQVPFESNNITIVWEGRYLKVTTKDFTVSVSSRRVVKVGVKIDNEESLSGFCGNFIDPADTQIPEDKVIIPSKSFELDYT